ncbi:MAG TPA: hypothetical protein VGH23_03295 [Rhizomicrobium sp.]|jgi:hypothetical protein
MEQDGEIQAMAIASRALDELDEAARKRVLAWLCQRFGGGHLPIAAKVTGIATPIFAAEPGTGFAAFAELFDAADPKTEKEKALVAAYWVQISQGQPSFPAQTLNSNLKDLGHGVGNITDSLDTLKTEKPALILQLKKSGTSKQARKTYKLTSEGARRVQQMISKEES